ncbi:C-type lectin domain family 4 member K [Suncus etruscus]|uniref:C-type lectin domain family 4 member K n=1 Tax=Suncus etruscus TaxID=109475 RepID=UPI002110C3AC|nr:C-type lectin domain family 4 member K [Suncus etruscus]
MKAGESEVHDVHFSVEKQNISLWPREPPPKASPSLVLSRRPTLCAAVICLALVLVASVVMQAALYSWLQGKISTVKTNTQLLNNVVSNISTLDSEIKRNRGGMKTTDFQVRTVNTSLNQVLSKIQKLEIRMMQASASVQMLTASWEEVNTLNSQIPELRKNLEKANALNVKILGLQKNLENIDKKIKHQNDILQMVSQDWKYFEGNFYYFSRISKTWYSAEQFCLSRDSKLTSVTSDDEQEFLCKTAGGEPHWIGLSKAGAQGLWTWVDDTPFSKVQSSRYWVPGEPNNMGNNEHCVTLKTTSLRSWNDASCDFPFRFICKRPYIPSDT